MIEVSIIVQLREVTEDNRKGRCAVGVAQFKAPSATPQKSWNRQFEDASRRALTQRHAMIERNHLADPRQEQLGLLFQEQRVVIEVRKKKGSHDETPTRP
jgi:hypothetical protein